MFLYCSRRFVCHIIFALEPCLLLNGSSQLIYAALQMASAVLSRPLDEILLGACGSLFSPHLICIIAWSARGFLWVAWEHSLQLRCYFNSDQERWGMLPFFCDRSIPQFDGASAWFMSTMPRCLCHEQLGSSRFLIFHRCGF